MTKLMIANWKSNKNVHQVDEWLSAFHKEYEVLLALGKVAYDVVICPAYPFVLQVSNWIQKTPYASNVFLGTQDMSPFSAGSYTGAVAAQNLAHLNVKYSIVGHSERRKFFKETSLEVSKKVESCLEESITPVVCVDRFEIEQQASLIHRDHYEQLVIAYEPVQHVGTGIPQDVHEVLEAMKECRNAFPNSKIIYGGSLSPDNISDFNTHSEIEGFLVGNSSLHANKFVDMLKM